MRWVTMIAHRETVERWAYVKFRLWPRRKLGYLLLVNQYDNRDNMWVFYNVDGEGVSNSGGSLGKFDTLEAAWKAIPKMVKLAGKKRRAK